MGSKMADEFSVKFSGLDDLRRALADIPEQLRKRVLLGALRKAARVPLIVARTMVPVMSSGAAAKNPYRTAGLLKKRLTVRTSRESRKLGNVGVFINIKPAAGAKYRTTTTRVLGIKFKDRQLVKAGQRGAKSPTDPFYWRFVEFGTKKMKGAGFIREAGKSLPQALEVFKAEVIPQINRLNNRK